MITESTLVVKQLEQLAPILRATVDQGDLDEVQHLVTRAPDDVSVAVVGRQNAGKTTLIAVLTRNPKAREDISSDIQTQTSVPYGYSEDGVTFTVWDTPGLGSERMDHDTEARDRITKADAVVIAVSTDLVSDVGREQLIELLKVGRKRGAVLPVVTKADREPKENRPGIQETLVNALPELGGDLRFVAAGEVLDAWEDGEEVPSGTGVPELKEALESLALGEARRRKEATAAIRLLALIDQVEEHLSGEEPEREVALRFQRRLRKLLTRTDRRLGDSLDAAERKQRLAAFRATATIGQALDKGAVREQLDVATAKAWDEFVADSAKRVAELSGSVSQLLADASAELERLQAGPLAETLKDHASNITGDGFDAPSGIDPVGGETAEKLLDAAQRAAKLLKGVKPMVKGKTVPLAPIATALLEGADWELERRRANAVVEAKESVREAYSERAEGLIETWEQDLDEIRDETTRSALARADQVEQELFDQLTSVRDQLEQLAESRRTLDAFVTEAVTAGYADVD